MRKLLLVMLAGFLTMAASARVNNLSVEKTIQKPQKSQMVCNQLKSAKTTSVANFTTELNVAPKARKVARLQTAAKAGEATLEERLNGAFIEDFFNVYDEENALGLDECAQIQLKTEVMTLEDETTNEPVDVLCVVAYGAFQGWADSVVFIVQEDEAGIHLIAPQQYISSAYESYNYGKFLLCGAFESEKEGYVSLGDFFMTLDDDNWLTMDEDLLGWYIIMDGGEYDGEVWTAGDDIAFMKANAMQYYYSRSGNATSFAADSCALYVDDYSNSVYLYGLCHVGMINVEIDETTLDASFKNCQPMYYEYYQGVDYVFNLSKVVPDEQGYVTADIYNDIELDNSVLFAQNYMVFGSLQKNEKTQQNEVVFDQFWIGTYYEPGQGASLLERVAQVEILLDNANFKAYDNYVANSIEELHPLNVASREFYNLLGQRVKNAKGFVVSKDGKAVLR